MGRWAQAKRRGGGGTALQPLGPPPAPSLTEAGGDLIQNAGGLDDTGGICLLLYSEFEEGPFIQVDSAPWDISLDWGPLSERELGWYRGAEVGNGVVYVGQSAPSEVYLFS